MSDTLFLERCQSYIDCHLKPSRSAKRSGEDTLPAVTLSRQTGAGGLRVARALAEWLQKRAPHARCPWTVFDKNIVQRVLEEHNLPSRLAQFMPEDKVSGIQDAVEELLGLHPPAWSLLRQTTETILHLAGLGNVILLGRGANVITARIPTVLHVRLVASVECRVKRIADAHRISQKAARTFLKKQDAARARYVRRNFGCDIQDPLLYHLTLNTEFIEPDQAVETIGTLVLKRCAPAD